MAVVNIPKVGDGDKSSLTRERSSIETGAAKLADTSTQKPIEVNAVVIRKESLGDKLKDVFLSVDAREVAAYVFYDIVLKDFRHMLYDAGEAALRAFLLGSVNASVSSPSNPNKYSNISRNRTNTRPVTQNTPYMGTRKNFGLDRIIFRDGVDESGRPINGRDNALDMIAYLRSRIDNYGKARVNDFYDHFSDALPATFTNNYLAATWGWTDLSMDIPIEPTWDNGERGWIIRFPEVKQL